MGRTSRGLRDCVRENTTLVGTVQLTEDDLRCSVVSGRDDGRVILVLERCRAKIDQSDVCRLEYPLRLWRGAALQCKSEDTQDVPRDTNLGGW
jgi:hypothetical protein